MLHGFGMVGMRAHTTYLVNLHSYQQINMNNSLDMLHMYQPPKGEKGKLLEETPTPPKEESTMNPTFGELDPKKEKKEYKNTETDDYDVSDDKELDDKEW